MPPTLNEPFESNVRCSVSPNSSANEIDTLVLFGIATSGIVLATIRT